IPGKGSGSDLSLTRAATTVLGMAAVCHPLGTNAGVEITSPLASTFAEVCKVQPSRSISLLSAAGFSAVAAAAAVFCWAARNELNRNCVRRKTVRDRGLPGFMGLLCRYASGLA